MNNPLFEVELAKAQIEYQKTIIVRFFIRQNAKPRILELYYNFFTNFCDVTKFEELEVHTDSLYLVFAERDWEDFIRPEMGVEGQKLRSIVDSFTADAVANLFPRTYCVKHKQHDKREPGLLKEEFICTEMLYLCSETYCCFDVTSNKPKFSSKGLNKSVLEQSGDGPLEKYCRVLNEKVNALRTIGDSEQTSTLLPPINKLRNVCPTCTQIEQSRVMECTLNCLVCKIFNYFLFLNIVYICNFIHSN